MYDLVKLTHLVAAIIWLGGMTFMLVALRPAAMAALERPERMRLMGAVWKRFFIVVVVAIVVVLVTGTNLYTTVFRALKMATGTGSVPLGWNLMLGIGLLMVLVFGHMFFAGYAKFKRAAAANDWPLADQAAAQIHALTVTNFVLGWLALLAVRLVR